ncbi:hypothetical protein [Streptomyces sp. NPDC057702]|uniref:hypothetical protein n=1 Tax=unclassified Streptomyces TaxID=2593676 RepID=UPI0036AF38EE
MINKQRVAVAAIVMGSGLALAPTAGAAPGPTPATASVRSDTRAAGDTDTLAWCSHPKFGGQYYCKSSYVHTLPNGKLQIFAIGTNKAAWTRWEAGSGLSAWTSLGGQCAEPGNNSINLYWKNPANKWNFKIQCKGTNHKRYLNERYASGKWSGWKQG